MARASTGFTSNDGPPHAILSLRDGRLTPTEGPAEAGLLHDHAVYDLPPPPQGGISVAFLRAHWGRLLDAAGLVTVDEAPSRADGRLNVLGASVRDVPTVLRLLGAPRRPFWFDTSDAGGMLLDAAAAQRAARFGALPSDVTDRLRQRTAKLVSRLPDIASAAVSLSHADVSLWVFGAMAGTSEFAGQLDLLVDATMLGVAWQDDPGIKRLRGMSTRIYGFEPFVQVGTSLFMRDLADEMSWQGAHHPRAIFEAAVEAIPLGLCVARRAPLDEVQRR